MGNNLTFTFACYDDFEAIHNTRWWSETEQHRWEIQGGEFSSGLVIDHEATRKSDKARTIIAKDHEGTVHTATWNPEATEIVWTDGDVWKRLDWVCFSCHRENFVDATVCRVCGAPRGQKYTDNAAGRYHGNAEMQADSAEFLTSQIKHLKEKAKIKKGDEKQALLDRVARYEAQKKEAEKAASGAHAFTDKGRLAAKAVTHYYETLERDEHHLAALKKAGYVETCAFSDDGVDMFKDFKDGLEALTKYVDKTGSVYPKEEIKGSEGDDYLPDYLTSKDPDTTRPNPLARWVQRQRKLCKNTFIPKSAVRKDVPKLTSEQKQQLLDIEFDFEYDPPLMSESLDDGEIEKFEDGLTALKEYRTKKGSTKVKETNTPLGKWVRRIRQQYANTYIPKKDVRTDGFGQMEDAQKLALDDLGFDFSLPKKPDPYSLAALKGVKMDVKEPEGDDAEDEAAEQAEEKTEMEEDMEEAKVPQGVEETKGDGDDDATAGQAEEQTEMEEGSAQECVDPFIADAKLRLSYLRKRLTEAESTNSSFNIQIPASGGVEQHNMASGIAVAQWKAESSKYGEAARLLLVESLQDDFAALKLDFPDRVSFGRIERSKASSQNMMLWSANAGNVNPKGRTSITGGGQAASMGNYGPGVFGIVTSPLAGNSLEEPELTIHDEAKDAPIPDADASEVAAASEAVAEEKPQVEAEVPEEPTAVAEPVAAEEKSEETPEPEAPAAATPEAALEAGEPKDEEPRDEAPDEAPKDEEPKDEEPKDVAPDEAPKDGDDADDDDKADELEAEAEQAMDAGSFSKAIEKYTEALKVVKQEKNKANLYLQLGKCADKQYESSAALEHYKKFIELSEKLDSPAYGGMVDALIRQAEIKFEASDYKVAREHFEAALELKGKANIPQSRQADLHTHAGDAAKEAGQIDIAKEQYTESLQLLDSIGASQAKKDDVAQKLEDCRKMAPVP